MPRYYFDTFNSGRKELDELGSDCEDLEVAFLEARMTVRDLAREAVLRGELHSAPCVEIRDQNGTVIGALNVKEVLEHPSNPSFAPSCDETG